LTRSPSIGSGGWLLDPSRLCVSGSSTSRVPRARAYGLLRFCCCSRHATGLNVRLGRNLFDGMDIAADCLLDQLRRDQLNALRRGCHHEASRLVSAHRQGDVAGFGTSFEVTAAAPTPAVELAEAADGGALSGRALRIRSYRRRSSRSLKFVPSAAIWRVRVRSPTNAKAIQSPSYWPVTAWHHL
jgi:hypothetical protein